MQEEIAWLADMAKRFHQAASIIDEIVEVKQVIEALGPDETRGGTPAGSCRDV